MFRLVRIRASCQYEMSGSVYDSLCIGRGQQNDLWTTDRLVSSAHARFFVRDSTLQLVDLDSRNGTEVNGQRLVPFEPEELERGDIVDVAGRLSFRVDIDDDAAYPTISVEEPEQADQEDILRVLALPEGLAPVLDASQLLKLHKLSSKLLNPQQQRQGTRWLETLVTGVARLIKVNEVYVVRRVDGRTRTLYPESLDTPLRDEAIIEAKRRQKAVAVEVSALDLDGVDPHSTVETHRMGPAFVPVLAAPIMHDNEPIAFLYTAVEEKGRRSFDEQDVWLMQEAANIVGHLISQVSMAQVVSRHHQRYREIARAAREESLVGTSPGLAATLGTLASLAQQDSAVLLEGPPGSDPARWARFLHGLSRRSGAPLSVIDTIEIRDFEEVENLLASSEGGAALFLNVDALPEDSRPDLLALLDSGVAARVRFLFASRYAPELLIGLRGFSPRLVRQMSRHGVRLPRLRERPEDLTDTVLSLARQFEADTDQFFTEDGRRRLSETRFDGDLIELSAAVEALLESTAVRPMERSHIDAVFGQHPRRETPLTRPALSGFHLLLDDDDVSVAFDPLAADLFRAGILD